MNSILSYRKMTENSEKKSWIYQNPKKTLFLVGFGIVFLILLIAEIVLRIIGYHAGWYSRNSYMNKVDTFILFEDYHADENGILKISPTGKSYVDSCIENTKVESNINSMEGWEKNATHDYSLKRLVIDYCKIDPLVEYENHFLDYVDSLKKLKNLDEWETEIVKYSKEPINNEGFRSVEAKEYPGKKPKILLIGDSFTWGLAANPITSSFADELLLKGNVVYNMGVVGVDPAQYMAVAEKYIPILKPDVVIVNFYMGNDILYHYREPKPYQMPMYPTNAGWIMADRLGVYFPLDKAHRYALSKVRIPDQDKKVINRLLGLTALGGMAWGVLYNMDKVPYTSEEFKEIEKEYWSEERSHTIIAESYMTKIHEIADSNDSKFLLSVIEDKTGNNPNMSWVNVSDVFKKEPYVICNGLGLEHYNKAPDGHFNNEGHKIYADFLQDKIDSLLGCQNQPNTN